MTLTVGLTARIDLTVGDADTAGTFRSGDVPVLATPRIVALVEEATVAVVTPVLADTETTVGVRVELDHTVPSPVGATVAAVAELGEIDGRALTFAVWVTQDDRVVARGRVRRVVVDRERFIGRLAD